MQIEVDKLTFMGHQRTPNGLEIDHGKVEAIQKCNHQHVLRMFEDL